MLEMLTEYAEELRKHQCRLLLAGVEELAHQVLARTGKLTVMGSENVFAVSMHYHKTVIEARTEAETWINQ
jgi:hypothetical protein